MPQLLITDAGGVDFLARNAYQANISNTTFNTARTLFMGDSITIGGGTISFPDQSLIGTGFIGPGCALSQGRILPIRTMGIAGQSSDFILARLANDIITYKPSNCHILAGTNDVVGYLPWNKTIANLMTMVDLCLKNGIFPMVGTLPPRDAAGYDGKWRIQQINNRLRQLAEQKPFLLIDYFTAVADPLTGNYLAANTSDGIHPSLPVGQMVMANTLAAAVSPFFAPSAPLCRLTTTADRFTCIDPLNYTNHGCYTTDSNADGVPDFWTGTPDGGHAYSLVTDANIEGQWVQIVKTTTALKTALSMNTATIYYKDLAIDASNSAQITSAAHVFAATDVGKLFIITNGFGFNTTDEPYTAIAYSAGKLTLDRAVGLVGSLNGGGRSGYGGGWEIGDKIAVLCRLQTVGVVAGGMTYQIRLNFTGSGGKFLAAANAWNYDLNPVGGAVVHVEGAVPFGTTAIAFEVVLNSGTGTIRIGNATFRNRTKMGIV